MPSASSHPIFKAPVINKSDLSKWAGSAFTRMKRSFQPPTTPGDSRNLDFAQLRKWPGLIYLFHKQPFGFFCLLLPWELPALITSVWKDSWLYTVAVFEMRIEVSQQKSVGTFTSSPNKPIHEAWGPHSKPPRPPQRWRPRSPARLGTLLYPGTGTMV